MANTIVAGELYESITGQLFELGRQLRQKGGYPYDPQSLKQALQAAIEGRFPKPNYELYLTTEQKSGGSIKGFDLEHRLKDEKLIDRCLSLESLMVKVWLADPSSYPEELKTKAVFLFGSQRGVGSDRHVACLCWDGDRVIVSWFWLEFRWYGYYPVLLASS